MISPWRIIGITLILILIMGWTGGVFFVFQGKPLSAYSDIQNTLSLSSWSLAPNTDTQYTTDTVAIPELTRDTIIEGDSTLYSSQQISLDDIINSITHHQETNDIISTKELQQRYTNTQDPETAIQLIMQLSQEFQYRQAYNIFSQLDSIIIKSLDPHMVMRILFNSDLIVERTQNTTYIDNIIGEFLAAGKLDPQETQRYRALLLLVQNKKEEFIVAIPVFEPTSSSIIKPLALDIRKKIQQSTTGPDMPSSYTDGLIALGMFQYGYPYLAQQLSFRILVEQPNYILPKQILAYSNLILQEWSQAQSYFLQLMSDDPKNMSNYQFFAGVSAYWTGKYADAILYLNQIPTDRITSDILRYKILSYIALKDRKNTTSIMRFLNNQSDINETDMMLAWEEIAFKPYMTQTNSPIFEQDNTILTLYLNNCTSKTLNPIICQIGQIAQESTHTDRNYDISTLENIIASFPRSYMYYILGEQYLKQGDTTSAQKSFVSALARTSDPEIKNKITEKIESLL